MKVGLEVAFAWWLRPYLWGLTAVAIASQSEPDWEKLGRVINRAIRLRLRPIEPEGRPKMIAKLKAWLAAKWTALHDWLAGDLAAAEREAKADWGKADAAARTEMQRAQEALDRHDGR